MNGGLMNEFVTQEEGAPEEGKARGAARLSLVEATWNDSWEIFAWRKPKHALKRKLDRPQITEEVSPIKQQL